MSDDDPEYGRSGARPPASWETELAFYDSYAGKVVAAARRKFIENLAKGKAGWGSMLPSDIAQRIAQEGKELADAPTLERAADEAGDVFNFAVFGYASAHKWGLDDDFSEPEPGERTDAENEKHAREWLEANPPIEP